MGRVRLYFDGWYMEWGAARACLDQCVVLGGVEIGIVESPWGTWGIVYWCDRELFANHTIDGHNAAAAVLRGDERIAEMVC